MAQESAEVVVIGTGFAGLAAAIEARLSGAEVVILEKMSGHGGNSVISDGMIAAAGTSEQAEGHIEDSPERMFEDMLRAGRNLNHPALAREVAERSREVFEWTRDVLGVLYESRIHHLGGHSVPRSHRTKCGSGAGMIGPLRARVRELGIPVRHRVRVERIETGPGGGITGVLVREGYRFPDPAAGRLREMSVKRALILASGGYGCDLRFRCRQDPRLTGDVDSTNRPGTTAEALVAALRVGAAPVQLEAIQLGPWGAADEKGYGVGGRFTGYVAFPYGLLVDPGTAKRVVNEMGDRKVRADAILQTGRPCIGIADGRALKQTRFPLEVGLRRGVLRAFDDLDALVRHYGMPPGLLEETVERYNAFVRAGEDLEFGKPMAPDHRPLAEPPFVAVRLWPKVHYTMGGVQIDRRARVMDLDGAPIPGLYAAGEITGGVHGACRLGSCAITDCFVFGRLAGQGAAGGVG